MEPVASRPFMPGYGVLDADEGAGLLPWSWAEAQLSEARSYWLATASPGRAPHVMPVWAVWLRGALWFSSSLGSRKARNLTTTPDATMTTDDPHAPVVVEGVVEIVRDLDAIGTFLDASNAKYEVDYTIDFLDPAVNGTFRLVPRQVIGLRDDDFTGTPTRWRFEPRS